MGRTRALGWLLLLLLLWASRAGGEEEYGARLLAAARALDESALRELAEQPEWDVWLAVDFLSRKGLEHAAPKFARHTRVPDRARLVEYAERLPMEVPGAREGIAEAKNAVAEGGGVRAIDALRALNVPAMSLVAFERLRVLADALQATGQTGGAAEVHAEAAQLAAALGWLAGEDIALDWRFWCLIDEARYADLFEVLKRRRALNKRLQNELELGFIDRWEGAAHLSLGTPAPALAFLRRALGVFVRAKRVDDVAHVRTQIALAHAMRGEFALALSEAEAAERASRAAKHEEGVLYAQQTRVSVLLDMGKYALAVDLGERVLGAAAVTEDPSAHASVLSNVAMGLARLEGWEAATQRFEEALSLCRAHDLEAQTATVLTLRGLELHRARGDAKAALTDFEAARKLVAPGSAPAAYVEFGIGAVLADAKAYARARPHLEAALAQAKDLEIVDLQSLVHERLLAVALAAGSVEAALAHARAAAEAMDLAAHGLSDEEAMEVRTQRERARIFRNWIRAADRLEAPASALYEAIEAGRGRLLLAALGGAASVRGLDLPRAVADEERRAQADLLAARERYATLRKNDAPRLERIQAHKVFVRARTAFREVVGRVQRERGARGALAYPDPVALTALQGRLAGDAVLVLFATRPDGADALVVTKAGARRHVVKEWSALRAACEIVGDPDADGAAFEAGLARIASGLLGDLELPPTIRRIFLSPDGPLAAVPWPALELGREQPRLIALVPSASTYFALEGTPPGGDGVLAFGDPLYEQAVGGRPLPWLVGTRYLLRLEHSAAEVTAIAGTPFLRGAATETRFKQEVARRAEWDLVHLACHGVMDRETPSLSSLALSPSAQDDGFLTAIEVFGMRLRANLVVLSACDVGRGQQTAGEGVLGLVRAFMAAGSPRLLVSLWAADDEATAALMKRFHEARKQGARPHEALRVAQRQVREFQDEHGHRPWAAPYFWAGWVLWGAFD